MMQILIETDHAPGEWAYEKILQEFKEAIRTCESLYKSYDGQRIKFSMRLNGNNKNEL
jgi:hypothetical protein